MFNEMSKLLLFRADKRRTSFIKQKEIRSCSSNTLLKNGLKSEMEAFVLQTFFYENKSKKIFKIEKAQDCLHSQVF